MQAGHHSKRRFWKDAHAIFTLSVSKQRVSVHLLVALLTVFDCTAQTNGRSIRKTKGSAAKLGGQMPLSQWIFDRILKGSVRMR